MQMPAAKPALLLFVLLLAATTEAAPAPVYKERPSLESAHRALPGPLRDEIELTQQCLPELIAQATRSSKLARTQKEKDAYLGTVGKLKERHYFYPIQHLEYQRKQLRYQGREDQQKIEAALKFYRLQYEEAKRKGLFRPKDPHRGESSPPDAP